MKLSKPQFFGVLFLLLVGPFILYRLFWIADSAVTTGTMRYQGKSYYGKFAKQYAVIRFFVGKDTVYFNGMDNYLFRINEVVPVRYQESNPGNARINTFSGLWTETLMYTIPLVLILLISFLYRGILPANSRIAITIRKPFLTIS